MPTVRRSPGLLIVPGWRVLRLLRLAERAERSRFSLGRPLGSYLRYRLAKTWGVFVHPSATVGEVLFAHPASVVIGAGVVLEDDVIVYQNTTFGALHVGATGYPMVGRGATVYAGASIIGPVVVGRDAVVGAHSLVLDSVPEGATVAGTPARPSRDPSRTRADG